MTKKTDTHTHTETGGFEIGSIATVTEAEFELVHPRTRLGLGAFFTLAGPEHPMRKQWGIDQVRKARAQAAARSAAPAADDAQEQLDDYKAHVLSTVIGWRGIKKDGQDQPFSPSAAQALLLDPSSAWIVEQVVAVIGRSELFTSA